MKIIATYATKRYLDNRKFNDSGTHAEWYLEYVITCLE